MAIRKAMCNGQIDVIKWFYNLGYKFEYCTNYVSYLSKNKHRWFFNGDLVYRYTQLDLNFIIRKGYLDLFDWLFEIDEGFKFTDKFINIAIQYSHIHIMNWIKNKGYLFIYSFDALEHSCDNDNTSVLKWFKKHDIIIKITDVFIVEMTIHGYVNVLSFLNSNEINYYYDHDKHLSKSNSFKNFVNSINLKDTTFNYKITVLEKYECSINWYKKAGFNINRIKWMCNMKIRKDDNRVWIFW